MMPAYHAPATTPLANALRIQCPACRYALEVDDARAWCARCERAFPRSARGQRDLRLQPGQAVAYQMTYQALPYDQTIELPLRPEAPCAEPRNTLRGSLPPHVTAAQMSYVPQAAGEDLALDLGCGHGIHRQVLEALGYAYHGVDYAGDAADDLVDAHALPYGDDQFALAMSVAVLEHLAQPLLALREVHRVLRPGGYFIGTVAFLEPFHDNSFSHFTHLGTWHALRFAGFAVEAVMPIRGWHVARAQLEMGLGAKLPGWLTRAATQPFALAVELYAMLGRMRGGDAVRHQRSLALARHAGAFFFVARKADERGEG